MRLESAEEDDVNLLPFASFARQISYDDNAEVDGEHEEAD